MKINEVVTKGIINEGPLDKLRQLGAGARGLSQGGIGGAAAGWSAQGAANVQSDLIKKVVSGALQQWAAIAQSIKSSGQEATPDQAVAWFSKFMNGTPTGAPDGTTPAQMNKWLTKEISNYIAHKEIGNINPPVTDNTASSPELSLEPMPAGKPRIDHTSVKTPQATVQTPAGTVTKNADNGRWYDSNNEYISIPTDIAELERRLKIQQQTAAMGGK